MGRGHLSPGDPSIEVLWRGSFADAEVNALHAAAFSHEAFDDDWTALTDRHSLGWVTARSADELVGFANVVTDGQVHAWLQDVMVSPRLQRSGVGARLVAAAEAAAADAGCEWLHVDFDEVHTKFYIDICGFTPTPAGIKHLG